MGVMGAMDQLIHNKMLEKEGWRVHPLSENEKLSAE